MMMLFTQFGLTRDSALWFWGKAVSIASLIAMGAFDLKAFGLTENQVHLVMGLAGAILAFSAQMSNSGLPSKREAEKVAT